MSDILSEGEIKNLERDRVAHQRTLDIHQRKIKDIDAKLAAHRQAVFIRDMPEPKLDLGCELILTVEFHQMLKRRRWASWELDMWSVGSRLVLKSFDLDHQVVVVDCTNPGAGTTGNVPIELAQAMRRAYLERKLARPGGGERGMSDELRELKRLLAMGMDTSRYVMNDQFPRRIAEDMELFGGMTDTDYASIVRHIRRLEDYAKYVQGCIISDEMPLPFAAWHDQLRLHRDDTRPGGD